MTKVCSRCHIEKPERDFAKSDRHRAGVHHMCRSCFSTYHTERALHVRGVRTCRGCGETKPMDEFSGRAARCHACLAAAARARRAGGVTGGPVYRSKLAVLAAAPEGHIHCPGCRTAKPPNQFWANSRRPGGKQVYCIPCSKARR